MMQNFFLDFQRYFPPGVTVTSHKPVPSKKRKMSPFSLPSFTGQTNTSSHLSLWIFQEFFRKRVFMGFQNWTLREGFVNSVNDGT